MAGTDPTNTQSKFTAKIEMKGGSPVVTWSPALNGEGVREGSRTYRVWGMHGESQRRSVERN